MTEAHSRGARAAVLATLWSSSVAQAVCLWTWVRQLAHLSAREDLARVGELCALIAGFVLGGAFAARERGLSPLLRYACALAAALVTSLTGSRVALSLREVVLASARDGGPGGAHWVQLASAGLLVLVPAAIFGAAVVALGEWSEPDAPARGRTRLAAHALAAIALGVVLAERGSEGLRSTTIGALGAAAQLGACMLLFPVLVLEHRGERLAPRAGPAVAAPPALAVAAGAGVALALLWARALVLVLGASRSTTSIGLVVWLAGAALGARLAAAWQEPSPRASASLLALLGAWAIGTAPLFWLLPAPFLFLRVALWSHAAAAGAVAALVLFLPAAAGAGAVAALARGAPVARFAGGACLAAVPLTILVLVPFAGTAASLQLWGLAALATGLWHSPDARRALEPASARAALALALAFLVFPPATRGWFGAGAAPSRVQPFWEQTDRRWTAVLDEDASGVVSARFGEGFVDLFVDGRLEASSAGNLDTQVLLAELPLALRPAPRRVLLVGAGSGLAARRVLMRPVERVDCAEPRAGVAAALPYFAGGSPDPRRDARFRLVGQGGRHFLESGVEPYDVVVLAAPHPRLAAASGCYSREMLESVARRLSPAGVVSCWFPLQEIDMSSVRLFARTFCLVFPGSRAFLGARGRELIFLGERDPAKDVAVSLSRAVAGGPLGKALEIAEPLTLLSREAASPSALASWTAAVEPLEDEWPALDASARAAYERGDDLGPYQVTFSPDALAPRYLGGREPTDRERSELAGFLRRNEQLDGLVALLLPPGRPRNPRLVLEAAEALAEQRAWHDALSLAKEAFTAMPGDAAAARCYFRAAQALEGQELELWKPRSMAMSWEAVQALVRVAPDRTSLRSLFDLALLRKDLAEARRALDLLDAIPVSPLDDRQSGSSQRWLELAAALHVSGDAAGARAARRKAERLALAWEQARARTLTAPASPGNPVR